MLADEDEVEVEDEDEDEVEVEVEVEVDVAIVGAGPAGATTALNLARFRRVLLLDRDAAPRDRIGESLPGAARRLLTDMGLWDGFASDGHLPRYARSSRWGGAEPVERDALGDPDGPGWHLWRTRFEGRLRAVAAARGAQLVAPARVVSVSREGGLWRLQVDRRGVRSAVRARVVVDAGGRGSRLLADHGARRTAADRLVCSWMRARGVRLPPGISHVEAAPDGWWYATPLPGGDGLVAFHTDADLPSARDVHSVDALRARASRLPLLRDIVVGGAWSAAKTGFCAANGAWLASAAGDGWIAVGDAALAFDPLAAQGLFNALYTGLAGAETVDRYLHGETAALADYANEIARVRRAYEAHITAWYGLEERWPTSPFWSRRCSGAEVSPEQR